MAIKKNGTLYIGVSGDLPSRVTQHKEGLIKGFTQKYNVKTLVWLETFGDIRLGIQRERTMNKWPRQWKSMSLRRKIQSGMISMRRFFENNLWIRSCSGTRCLDTHF
jgi:putative endonuclease